MNIEELCKHPECANIEYKSSWYWDLNDKELKNNEKSRLWGEFIKDFLALTNGNLESFDKIRYMVIGFNESEGKFQDSTINEVYFENIKNSIKSKLNSSITDFTEIKYQIKLEVINNKNIVILEIEQPFRLFYLNIDIQTKTIIYKKNTVLYRGNDGNSTGNNDNVGVMSQPHIKKLEAKIFSKYGVKFTPIKIHKPTTISNTVASYLDKNKTFTMNKGFPILSDDSKNYFELYELENSMNGDKIYIAYIADINLRGSLENLYEKFITVTKPSTKLLLLVNKPSDSSSSRRISYIKSSYKNIFPTDSNVDFIEDFGKKYLYQEYLNPMLFDQYYQNTEFFIESYSSKINDNQKQIFASKLLKKWFMAENSPLVVLTGSGGVGKTTIVREFLNTNLKMNEDQFVLFLDSSSLLDQLKSDRISTIYDLYRASISDTDFFTEELFKLSIDNGSFIIILDGLDEIISGVNVEFQLQSFLKNIFDSYCFNLVKTKIIITCRDYIWEEAFNQISEEFLIENIEIQPFNKTQTDQFFQTRFKNDISLQRKSIGLVKKLMDQSNESYYSPFMLDTIGNLVYDDTDQEGIENIFEMKDIDVKRLGLRKDNILDYLIYAVCKREVKKISIDFIDQINILCKLSTINKTINKTDFTLIVKEFINETNDTTISLLLNHAFINHISDKSIIIRYDFLKDFFLKISVAQIFSSQVIAGDDLLNSLVSKVSYLNNFSLDVGKRLNKIDTSDILLATLLNIDNINLISNAEDKSIAREKYYQYISKIFILYLGILKSNNILKQPSDLRKALIDIFSDKPGSLSKLYLCDIRDLKQNPKLLFDFKNLKINDCYIYNYYGFIDCDFNEDTLFDTGSIKIPSFKNHKSQLRKSNLSKKILQLGNTSEILESIDSPSQTNDSKNLKSLRSLVKLFHNNGKFKPRKSAEIRKKQGGDLVNSMLNNGVIQTNRNSKLNQEEFKINPESEVALFQFLDSGVTTPKIYEMIKDL